MPKAAVTEESPYYHEEGWGDFDLKSVEEREVEYTLKAHHKAVKDGKARIGEKASFVQWSWTFVGRSAGINGDEFEVGTDPKVTTREGDKARLIAEAILGRPLDVGAGVDTDVFEGMSLQAYIKHRPPVEKKDGNMGYYSTLSDFAPKGTHDTDAGPVFSDEPPF